MLFNESSSLTHKNGAIERTLMLQDRLCDCHQFTHQSHDDFIQHFAVSRCTNGAYPRSFHAPKAYDIAGAYSPPRKTLLSGIFGVMDKFHAFFETLRPNGQISCSPLYSYG